MNWTSIIVAGALIWQPLNTLLTLGVLTGAIAVAILIAREQARVKAEAARQKALDEREPIRVKAKVGYPDPITRGGQPVAATRGEAW